MKVRVLFFFRLESLLVIIRNNDIIDKYVNSRCSAVGSVRALGAWGRRFEPCHLDQEDLNRSSDLLFFASDFECEGETFFSVCAEINASKS